MKHKLISLLAILLVLISYFLLRGTAYLILAVVFIIIIYSVILISGVSQIKLNYFVNSINKGKIDAIAITFDDGPDADLTPPILEILDRENIKATFFVIGKKAEQNPELLKEIDKRGHVIANHSFSHSKLIALFSRNKLQEDIFHCSSIIENAIGKKPSFFRPPFGITNPRYNDVLDKLKLHSIGWTLRSFDTTFKDSQKLLNRIKALLTKGSIVLLHDTQKVTVETLPLLIEHCRKQNIKIVSLPELIKREPYEKS